MKNKRLRLFDFIFNNMKLLIFLVFIITIGYNILFSFNDTEYIITVTDKESVYTINSKTSMYLIFGDDENGTPVAFKNTDNPLRGKWDSSNIQGQLKEGHTYTITVVGLRIPFLSLYQNIIKIEALGEIDNIVE